MLGQWGTDEAFATEVRRLILTTRHAETPTDADAMLIVDIDLSILGQPWARFEEYERGIRREYAHVSDEAFRAGRAKVLRGFLGRPRIYSTDWYQERLEERARENLRRSIGALEQG